MAKTNYLLAFYELDRKYGGPEEGGWWYDCGTLVRVFKVCATPEKADELAHRANRLLRRLQRGQLAYRANRLLSHLQRGNRDTGSMAYSGGRYMVDVYKDSAPPYFPVLHPTYE